MAPLSFRDSRLGPCSQSHVLAVIVDQIYGKLLSRHDSAPPLRNPEAFRRATVQKAHFNGQTPL